MGDALTPFVRPRLTVRLPIDVDGNESDGGRPVFRRVLSTCAKLDGYGRWARLTFGAFAVVVFALGLAGIWPWLERAPDLVFSGRWAAVPIVLRWLAVYGSAFAIATGLTLAAGQLFRRRSPSLGVLCDATVALGFIVALIVVLNLFMMPIVREPWRSVALTCGSLAATLLLASAIIAALPRADG